LKFNLVITASDKARFTQFVTVHKNHDFVKRRIQRNIKHIGVSVTQHAFWKKLIVCLVTTMNRSGENGVVSKFVKRKSDLLDIQSCLSRKGLRKYAAEVLSESGIWRAQVIAGEIALAAETMNKGEWKNLKPQLNSLQRKTNAQRERAVARYLQKREDKIALFKGIGPKQSRNLLQGMGLSKYEIPLDSRMINVLRELDFPVPVSATALSDEDYYCFVLDILQDILARVGVLPCVFDACAFASKEKPKQVAA